MTGNVLSLADVAGDGEDFFSRYFAYTSDTEVPAFFHRWAAIASIGAFLGRGYYFSHGHFVVNPNIYCMLVGSPGTRKSTAIKLAKGLLIRAGYDTIAADKTSKEKFLMDLAGLEDEDTSYGRGRSKPVALDELNLFGADDDKADHEMLIAADEFNDFIGLGNVEFISLLGNLWDYSGVFKSRIKSGKSVSINNPTVSILGGNTPTGLSLAFPPEVLGQGFFSRLLFVYGEPTGRKITFPKAPCPKETEELVRLLHRIKNSAIGPARLTGTAEKLLDKMYKTWAPIPDPRFEHYSNRRFTHLLNLCLIVSAARCSNTITEGDVIYANTILMHTEHLMPKALGEFGKGKHSDVMHKIVQYLEATNEPVGVRDIWKVVVQDLEKLSDLSGLLSSLVVADKIQQLPQGFLPKRKVLVEVSDDVVDYSLLSPAETQGR